MNQFDNRRKLIDLVDKKREKWAQEEAEGEVLLCPSCQEKINPRDLEDQFYVCPSCSYHLTMPAKNRLEMLFGKNYSLEQDEVVYTNPNDFPNYIEKLEENAEKSGLKEAIQWGRALLVYQEIVFFALDSSFIMGSMGSYVGEQITKAFEFAGERGLGILGISTSGGARMQEGLYSLLQMVKTVGACQAYADQGGCFISLLTNPTTGGVTASYSMLGDINLAEPGALIGFAGPRVIKETIGRDLPEGFQTAEFLEEKGFVDKIVERKDQVKVLELLFRIHRKGA